MEAQEELFAMTQPIAGRETKQGCLTQWHRSFFLSSVCLCVAKKQTLQAEEGPGISAIFFPDAM